MLLLLLLLLFCQVDKDLLKELLVHGLPKGVTSGEIFNALAAAAPSAPLPKRLEESKLGEGRLTLVFKNPADVEALFQALPGAVTADSIGRRMKQVELAGGAKVRLGGMGGAGWQARASRLWNWQAPEFIVSSWLWMYTGAEG